MSETHGYFELVQKLKNENKPFALATVIAVKGSASAKPGSKAIFNEAGKNIWGWVGGGCAESFVAKNAMESMTDGQTRIVQADLDDEIFGLGMPCGGIMDVYIEPQKPIEKITIKGLSDIKDFSLHIAGNMGFDSKFSVRDDGMKAPVMEHGLYSIAEAIAEARSENFESLKKNRKVFPEADVNKGINNFSELLIVGSSRITEELAKLGTILKWKVRVYGWNLDSKNYPAGVEIVESTSGFTNFEAKKHSAVIVASHHKGDHDFIKNSIAAGAGYVGLIASTKRSGLILEHLKSLDMNLNDLSRVHAPAGLEMKCLDPQEIALSCLAEIIGLKNAK
ncbi:MAG: XdhC family protein [Rhizobacter sp.]|nr:XdhC family protein [Bacteriovorax sp.]